MFSYMTGDGETTVVGVRIDDSRHEELSEYVEEAPEYRSLPDLFRTAVAHEMSDSYGLTDTPSDSNSTSTSDSIGEVLEEIHELNSEIAELRNEVDALGDEVRDGVPGDRMESMNAIYARLPSERSEAIGHEEIAEEFDDVGHEQAFYDLIRLYEETPKVRQTGENKFWIED